MSPPSGETAVKREARPCPHRLYNLVLGVSNKQGEKLYAVGSLRVRRATEKRTQRKESTVTEGTAGNALDQVRGQQTVAQGQAQPTASYSIKQLLKFSWPAATPLHSQIVLGCLGPTTAEVSHYNTDPTARKA